MPATLTPRRAPLPAVCSLALLVVGVFWLPYFVPVPPSLSISYMAGFNNKVAILAFLVSGLLFAFFTGGVVPPAEERDRKLPAWTFWATISLVGAGCASLLLERAHRHMGFGAELSYEIERQSHLDIGQRLYRDFEYAYGPLLLYPGHWFHELFHVSAVTGYHLSWWLMWVAGAAMMWFVVAKTNLPTRYRGAMLIYLVVTTMQGIVLDGVNYTPARAYSGAFGCVAVYAFWRRYRRPYATAGMMAAAVAFGFAMSAEQGGALMVGFCAYALVLAWHDRMAFPYGAALTAVGSIGIVYAVVAHAGLLLTAHRFAQGGLNFPLLPSPINLFLLAVYVCGLGLFLRKFLAGEMNNIAVPLGLCGVPMLLSAMGRSDSGHLMSAIPLAMAGIFALSGRPWPFRVWLLVGCYFFVNWEHPVRFVLHQAWSHPLPVAVPRAAASKGSVTHPALNRPIDPGRTYYAPALPPIRDGRPIWNVQSGYFHGMENTAGSDDIEAKRVEIEQRRAPYLVLPDVSDPIGYAMMDLALSQRYWLKRSRWMPPQRHAMPSWEPILKTIETMYVPTDEAQDGWRVWRLR